MASEVLADPVASGLKRAGVRFCAYVPDNALGPILDRLAADPAFVRVPVCREEEAFGVLAGVYAGGGRAAVLLQVSGVGNSLNAIASLLLPHRIPAVMIVSQRGELGEFNPAQAPMGRALRPVLDALGVMHFTPSRPAEAGPLVRHAAALAYDSFQQVAVILPRLFPEEDGR